MTFDEMIGQPEQFSLSRRPLLTLGEIDEEEKATPEAVTYHGQRAKENKFGDSGDSFISKLLASKYGQDSFPSPTAASLRGNKPYQAGAEQEDGEGEEIAEGYGPRDPSTTYKPGWGGKPKTQKPKRKTAGGQIKRDPSVGRKPGWGR
jgi:hypothetical protein